MTTTETIGHDANGNPLHIGDRVTWRSPYRASRTMADGYVVGTNDVEHNDGTPGIVAASAHDPSASVWGHGSTFHIHPDEALTPEELAALD